MAFELKEYIQEKKEKGGIVSERLVMLTDSLDEEQNPVLVIANLKNRWIWNFFMRMILILGVMVLGFTACSNKKNSGY